MNTDIVKEAEKIISKFERKTKRSRSRRPNAAFAVFAALLAVAAISVFLFFRAG